MSEEDRQLFAQYLYDKNEKKVNENRKKRGYKTAGSTKLFTLDEVRENLYGDKITEPNVYLELIKECIDLITRIGKEIQRLQRSALMDGQSMRTPLSPVSF